MIVLTIHGEQVEILQRFKNIDGERFGRLVVVGLDHREVNKYIYKCVCDCGNICFVNKRHLVAGNTKSCGCIKHERVVEMGRSKKTHGMEGTRPYKIYHGMKARCGKTKGYEYISFSEEWDTFEKFWIDMEEGYSGTLTLDRINPFCNYEKENCRWITIQEQARNKKMFKNNVSGVTGVARLIIHDIPYWIAYWNTNGSRTIKYFSINSLGDNMAKEEAIRARVEGVDNEQENKYSKHHGLQEDIS